MNDFLNDDETLPTPPQPPMFSTCSAPPGSQEWLLYWANQANEATQYNKKIHEYGRQMMEWTKNRTGACLVAAQKAAAVYTTSQQLLDKTTSTSETDPANLKLESNEIKSSPCTDNEEPNKSIEKFDENDNFTENEIRSCSSQEKLISSTSTKESKIESIGNVSSAPNLDESNSMKKIQGTQIRITESSYGIRESVLVESLQQNMDNRIAGVMHTIYDGFTGLLHNIKEGISTAIFDSPHEENLKALTTVSSYVEEKWLVHSKSSRTITSRTDEPQIKENPLENNEPTLNLNSHATIQTVDGIRGSETPPTTNSNISNVSESKEKGEKKYNLIQASMELGAFEINASKESNKNSSGIQSGITCRILGFTFKRISTKDCTRLIFNEPPSSLSDDSHNIEVTPRLGVGEERNLLEVKATRNGCVELLNILLPNNAIFENIKIEKKSAKLSVTIPFPSVQISSSSLEKYFK